MICRDWVYPQSKHPNRISHNIELQNLNLCFLNLHAPKGVLSGNLYTKQDEYSLSSVTMQIAQTKQNKITSRKQTELFEQIENVK